MAKTGLTLASFGQAFTPFFVDGAGAASSPAPEPVQPDTPTGGAPFTVDRERIMIEEALLRARIENEVDEWILLGRTKPI